MLKIKLNIIMEEVGDFSEFECCMIVTLLTRVLENADFLGLSCKSLGFTKNNSKKQKIPSERQVSG